jgi:hypothetical protein
MRYDEAPSTESKPNTSADIQARLQAMSESPQIRNSQTEAERDKRARVDSCMSVALAGIDRKFAERAKELRESIKYDFMPAWLTEDLNRLSGYRTGQAAVAGIACSQGYNNEAVEDLLLQTEPKFMP